MTTDITELAQSLKAAAEKYKSVWGIARYSKAVEAREKFHELVTPANVIALVEALEKAQQERENWRTSFDNERFRADKLKAYIDDMEPIRAAAEKLVRCKGRYHSEQNYRALAALFGVKTPDLPPLEHENVHYADAAEMEIAALRQRIAELESRTVKLPDLRQIVSGDRYVWSDGVYNYSQDVKVALADAGIKWEAE
ncbi:TPA: ead/Ea22-like family protein [Klebsiella pneumoniae]|nr:ead/Ea22-like family protein [Klebsiella pneumoniae]